MAVRTKSVKSGYGWVVLAVCFLAGCTCAANMAKVTSLAPLIMSIYGFSPDVLGWVIAVFYVMGFVLAFPTAAIIGKIGIRNAILVAVACSAAGSLLGALASGNLALFMVSRIIEGAGMGVMGVAGASAIAPWFAPERRGLPMGIWSMWVALCMCICPALYGWMTEARGLPYTAVWWGNVVFDVIVGVVFFLLYAEPAEAQLPGPAASAGADGGETGGNIRRAFKNKTLWMLALIFLLDEAAFMGVNGFLTTYLQSELGTTLVFATMISSMFGVAGAIFAPVSGAVADWLKNRKWLLLGALFIGILYTCVVFVCRIPALYYAIAIPAGVVGGVVPSCIMQAIPQTVDRPDDIPAANAMVGFTQNIGMFIGSIFMGQAITAFGWMRGAWTALMPCFIVCVVIFLAGLRKAKF
ncbi:MAG: MFS transporter [Lachnospiraceae bacterium]|nr:MFS transporter [Lachnospiraceae bacterium]MBQ9464035.1 MFS transporter [Lachnospiraceae bacterium]